MKKFYLVLAIIGFIAPNIFVIQESLATGNWFFLVKPQSYIGRYVPQPYRYGIYD